MKRKIVISLHNPSLVISSIPEDWEYYSIVTPLEFKSLPYVFDDCEIYPWGDTAYNIVSETVDRPQFGFSKMLSYICNHKYICRSTLQSMKSIPYKICKNNRIEWKQDENKKLIAKPIHGSGSRDIHIVYHGDNVPDIKEDYIVEEYIDDSYPRLSIDGYICDGVVGILSIWDSVYDKDKPLQFNYLQYPSVHRDNSNVIDKYVEVVKELYNRFHCNRQIIDIEFFLVGDEVKVMEINPRIGGNYLPIYEEVTGYNPWKCYESLYQGKIPQRTCSEKNGLCAYNYNYAPIKGIYQHYFDKSLPTISSTIFRKQEKNIFSIVESPGAFGYSHTYMYSSTHDINEMYTILKQQQALL